MGAIEKIDHCVNEISKLSNIRTLINPGTFNHDPSVYTFNDIFINTSIQLSREWGGAIILNYRSLLGNRFNLDNPGRGWFSSYMSIPSKKSKTAYKYESL